MEFPGVSKKLHVEFLRLTKNEVEFPDVTKKNHAEFPRILDFGLGISKVCSTDW